MLSYLKIISCLNFIMIAQGLISEFRIPAPAITEIRHKAPYRYNDMRRFGKQSATQLTYRRLCREFENYKKD